MENVKTTFLCIMAVALVYTSIKIWRNRVLRRGLPLPPGPKALPFIGNLLIMDTGRPWVTYAEWGRQYGGIIYSTLLEKDFIIINDNDIAYELLERRSAVYSDRPYLSTNEFFGLDFNTAFLPYGNKWRLHRKMTNFAFSKQASAAYKPMQIGRAYQLLENMISTPYDYVNHIYTFSGSVIMAITYGYDAAAENDPFVTKAKMLMVHAGNVLSGERAALLTAFPMLAYIPSWLPGGRYKQQAGECRALARQVGISVLMEHGRSPQATGSARKSLVYDILHKGIGQCADSNHVETTKEVAATAFGAGVETTSSTLQAFILAMTLYPEVQAKAQQEIDRVIGHGRLPDFTDRDSLPYVEAVFLETQRWCPVLPLMVPRYATTDDVFDGMYIPKDSIVLVNVWAISRNEKHFPDPASFKPERHLTADGRVAERPFPFFGCGRRMCPGRYVAEQSVWSVIVSILATLHISKARDELGNEIDVTPEFTTGAILHPKPFPCSIKARSVTAEELVRKANTNE